MPVALLNKINLQSKAFAFLSIANAIDYGRVNTVRKMTKTCMYLISVVVTNTFVVCKAITKHNKY